MQEANDIMSQIRSAQTEADEISLLAVVKTFLEQRGWAVSPGPAPKAGSLADRNEQRLCAAALRFAVELSGKKPRRFRRAVALVEQTLIAHAIKQYKGNQSAAADYLGLHRNTLRKKLREFGIDGLNTLGPEGPEPVASCNPGHSPDPSRLEGDGAMTIGSSSQS